MYNDYYHFASEPFRLTPDPSFVYPHASYSRARTQIRHALEQGDGIVVVTGRPGTGKTTLIEDLVADLKSTGISAAMLVSTHLGDHDILRMVAYAFGLEPRNLDKATILKELEAFLSSQPRALLIIDEAQNLPEAALEEIRMLTNMRVNARPLLQVFLVGQEKLHESLHSPGMEQLHQRLIAAYQLEPLNLQQTFEYILHRLELAGWRGHPTFSSELFILIYRFSQGLPRYICKFCSRLLLYGAEEKLEHLTLDHVAEVVATIQSELLLPLNGSGHSRTGEPMPDARAILEKGGEPIEQRIVLTPEEDDFIAATPRIIDSSFNVTKCFPEMPERNNPAIHTPSIDMGIPGGSQTVPRARGRKTSLLFYGSVAFVLLLSVSTYRLGVIHTRHEQGAGTVPMARAPETVRGRIDFDLSDYLLQTTEPQIHTIPLRKTVQLSQFRESSGPEHTEPAITVASALADEQMIAPVEESAVTSSVDPADSPTYETEAATLPQNIEVADTTTSGEATELVDADDRIEGLLQLGEVAIAEYRLTTPADASARRYYNDVLALDPDNEKAREGLEKIVISYRQLTEVMLERKQYELAALYIKRGLDVMPDPQLLALGQVLEERRLDEEIHETGPVEEAPREHLEETGFFASLKRLFGGGGDKSDE